jgi:hypothetical protein
VTKNESSSPGELKAKCTGERGIWEGEGNEGRKEGRKERKKRERERERERERGWTRSEPFQNKLWPRGRLSSQHCSKNHEFLVHMIVPTFNSATCCFAEHRNSKIYPALHRS